MSFNTYQSSMQPQTPLLIRGLLILLATSSVGFSLLAILFKNTMYFEPLNLFGLSLAGINKGYIFQLITYPFIQLPTIKFDFGYLIQTFFSLYLVWLTSTQILERVGQKKFLTLLISTILFTGGVGLGLIWINPYPYVLFGLTPVIFSLLVTWMMLNPSVRLILFFVLPVLAKHLVVGLIGVTLLIDFSNEDFIRFGVNLSSAVFAYMFSLFAFNTHSSFRSLYRFEKAIFSLRNRLKKANRQKSSNNNTSKIYDIRTGKPVQTDEQFLDEMLEKISNHGKDSLSTKEKKKMEEISKKRT